MLAYTSNQHCVEKLLVLSETHSIVATQDIYDESGCKLLAKGARISHDLQDRLLLRRLKAPLENSLSVHDGVTVSELMQGALELIGEYPALERIAGGRIARGLLRDARLLHLPPPLCLLLSCIRNDDPESYRRAQLVAAICAGIAEGLAASQHDIQLVLVAAAVHDIGEIYVNPDFLHPVRHLVPHEWKHVAIHPHVGQLLIRNLTSLPSGVAACVAQHHERHDGSGYPAQLNADEQHRLSAWIAVADAAAALIDRGEDSGERVSLALRIVPEEFDRQTSDVLIRALQTLPHCLPAAPEAEGESESPRALLVRLETAASQLRGVAQQGEQHAPLAGLCAKALGLLDSLAKSLRATGVLEAGELSGEDLHDAGLLAEMHQIISEVTWRMRNLARTLFLRVDAWNDEAAMAEIRHAITLLDGAPAEVLGEST